MTKRQEIEDHIARGRFIHAVKELRAVTGWGLKDAKEACDVYRADGAWPTAVLGVFARIAPYEEDEPPAPTVDPAAVGKLVDAAAHCADGRKIMAIKDVREAAGIGLKDAKDAVERYMATGRWDHPSVKHLAAAATSGAGAPGPAVTGRAERAASADEAARSAAPEQAKQAERAKQPKRAKQAKRAKQTGPAASGPAEQTAPSSGSPHAAASHPAVLALQDHLGQTLAPRAVAAARHIADDGFLVLLDHRAYYVAEGFGGYRFELDFAYSDVTRVELQTTLGAELHVHIGYTRERFSNLDDSDADAILAILRVYAD